MERAGIFILPSSFLERRRVRDEQSTVESVAFIVRPLLILLDNTRRTITTNTAVSSSSSASALTSLTPLLLSATSDDEPILTSYTPLFSPWLASSTVAALAASPSSPSSTATSTAHQADQTSGQQQHHRRPSLSASSSPRPLTRLQRQSSNQRSSMKKQPSPTIMVRPTAPPSMGPIGHTAVTVNADEDDDQSSG